MSAEEIRLVNEINEAAQSLDIIGKAKTIGFISGLSVKNGEMPKVRHNKPVAAV